MEWDEDNTVRLLLVGFFLIALIIGGWMAAGGDASDDIMTPVWTPAGMLLCGLL